MWKNNPTELVGVLVSANPSVGTFGTIVSFLSFERYEPFYLFNDAPSELSYLLTSDNSMKGIFRNMMVSWSVYYYQEAYNIYESESANYDLWLLDSCEPNLLSLNFNESNFKFDQELYYVIGAQTPAYLIFDLSDI